MKPFAPVCTKISAIYFQISRFKFNNFQKYVSVVRGENLQRNVQNQIRFLESTYECSPSEENRTILSRLSRSHIRRNSLHLRSLAAVCQLTAKSSQKFDRHDNFSRLSGLVVKLLPPLALLFRSLSLSLSLSVREIPVLAGSNLILCLFHGATSAKKGKGTREGAHRGCEKERKSGRKREREREREEDRGENRRGNDNVAVTRNETKRKCMRGDPLRPCYPSARLCNCVETSFGSSRPRDRGHHSARGKRALSSRITSRWPR